MTKLQRVEQVLIGFITFAVAVIMLFIGDDAYYLIVLVLCISMIAAGIRGLVYYFTMARFMVGGKAVLYRAVLILNAGLFTGTLTDIPRFWMILYLVAIHAFAGLVDILHGMENRRLGAKSWRLSVGQGIINSVMALLCLAFIRAAGTVVIIYSLGLLYSSLNRIANAFRRTAIVYIS